MDYFYPIILLIAGISAAEWYSSFRDNTHCHTAGKPGIPGQPDSDAYTMRNLVQWALIVLSGGMIMGSMVYGLQAALGDEGLTKPSIAGILALAIAGVVGIMRSVDRMVGERTQNLVAALGATPIQDSSAYAAIIAMNGMQLRFNLTCTRTDKTTPSGMNYVVNASCYVQNNGGLELVIYRYYAQLPMCLHPGFIPELEADPYKVRGSSGADLQALAAIRDMAAAIAAGQDLGLEYLYLKGDTLKARLNFMVKDEENDAGDALTLARLKGALEITSKAAAALQQQA